MRSQALSFTLDMWPGAAIFAPMTPAAHTCVAGPAWSAVVLPTSDRYSGLCQIGTKWITTGHGQAGATPSNSMTSIDGGHTWLAAGSMPNIFNSTPFSLRAGAHNGWAIAYGGSGLCWVTRDQGATWFAFSPGASFACICIDSGNGKFVYMDNAATVVYISASGAAVITFATPAKFSRCWWIASRGVWLCLENGGTHSWTTADFITFTAGPTMPFDSATVTPYGISQLGSNIVIVYNDAVSVKASYSTDNGLTFTASASFAGGSQQSYSVVHGNGVVLCTIAIGSTVQVSVDGGATWAAAGANTTVHTWILAFDSVAGFFAIGAGTVIDTIGNIGTC